MAGRKKKGDAEQSKEQIALSINTKLAAFDGTIITKCCRVEPILYVTSHGCCQKCGDRFKVHGDLLKLHPKLLSRSPADNKAENMNSAYKALPADKRGYIECNAKKPIKPLPGQKELIGSD